MSTDDDLELRNYIIDKSGHYEIKHFQWKVFVMSISIWVRILILKVLFVTCDDNNVKELKK